MRYGLTTFALNLYISICLYMVGCLLIDRTGWMAGILCLNDAMSDNYDFSQNFQTFLKIGGVSTSLLCICEISLAQLAFHCLSFQIPVRILSYVKWFPRYNILFAVMLKSGRKPALYPSKFTSIYVPNCIQTNRRMKIIFGPFIAMRN